MNKHEGQKYYLDPCSACGRGADVEWKNSPQETSGNPSPNPWHSRSALKLEVRSTLQEQHLSIDPSCLHHPHTTRISDIVLLNFPRCNAGRGFDTAENTHSP